MAEIAPFPRAVLAHRFPSVPLHGDFTTIEAGQYEPIDILVGGTPCQSFSVAGLRAGLADERGNLALAFVRLAYRFRPRWIVWENVPGVLSSNGGRDFGAFLGGVVECGYGFAYRVLDAQYFGVPQRRRRVFVVGYLGDWRRAAAVLFEREGLRISTLQKQQTRKVVSTSANDCASTNLYDTDHNEHRWDAPRLARCLIAGCDKKTAIENTFIVHTWRDNENSAIERKGVRILTPRECERLQGFPDDWTLVPYRGKAAADGPRYKALGNSMAVLVMRWIGRRIALCEAA
jgi:DNA (cytosine-5)-methyltransferase 1